MASFDQDKLRTFGDHQYSLCWDADKTLVVVSTEFGRPARFDGGGGRGHHSKAFSVVLAGGGLSVTRDSKTWAARCPVSYMSTCGAV